MDRYKFKLNESEKNLEMEFNGFFHNDEVIQFLSEYENILKSISSKDYILNINCKNMSVVKSDLIDSLSGAIKSYSDNFNKVFVIMDKSQLIFKMQVNRLIKELQAVNVSIIEQ